MSRELLPMSLEPLTMDHRLINELFVYILQVSCIRGDQSQLLGEPPVSSGETARPEHLNGSPRTPKASLVGEEIPDHQCKLNKLHMKAQL